MKYWIIVLGLSLLLLPENSLAEYYKYRDNDGVLRFTDNILEVPKDQRDQIMRYEEIKSTPTPETLKDAGKEATADTIERGVTLSEESFRNEKTGLDEEFKNLEDEKTRLTEASKKPRSPTENAAFTKRVKAYNERVKSYEEKRIAFKERVDAYNSGNQ